ncbi:VOC family protein [Chitinophaga lutea]|uniref:VOC family protein n=1 Tax=Chitinophaga lutea TaxID=2488634 RepID=A0A3N4QAL9_9BACT|nr:VOC family protein [Chitinophaga lutea]RPE08784.1 VOC family protein [Chitinophaga lutea]
MAHVNPYLTFGGNCEEAFNYYKSVLGGEFLTVMRYKDMPGPHHQDPADDNLVMHVALPIGKNSLLMGGDRPKSFGPAELGNVFSLAIDPDSREHADKLFEGLSSGGKADMPMGDAPWGAYFGMLTDKFGVQWMINYDANPKQ